MEPPPSAHLKYRRNRSLRRVKYASYRRCQNLFMKSTQITRFDLPWTTKKHKIRTKIDGTLLLSINHFTSRKNNKIFLVIFFAFQPSSISVVIKIDVKLSIHLESVCLKNKQKNKNCWLFSADNSNGFKDGIILSIEWWKVLQVQS